MRRLLTIFNWQLLGVSTIVLGMLLASAFAFYGDIFFHTDIARDFLLMAEMAETKKPALIGPRSGGIPGLFHGPLWLYLNIPAFIILQGNPSLMAIWWMAMVGGLVLMTTWVAAKLISPSAGLFSGALLAGTLISKSANIFNPFGAMLLSPAFLFCWLKYIKTDNWKYLALSFVLLGMIIHFQVAFGGPLLFLTIMALFWRSFKVKKWLHLLVIGFTLLPLSTYLVFDIRHDWIQSRAVYQFVTSSQSESAQSIISLINDRLDLAAVKALSISPSIPGFGWTSILGLLVIWSMILIGLAKYKNANPMFRWILYFYVGFWLISIFYPGSIWSYYYQPFIPWIVLLIASTIQQLPRRLFSLLFGVLIMISLVDGLTWVNSISEFSGKTELSWLSHRDIAAEVFSQAEAEFGYFAYTPDLYAYQPQYAMKFLNKFYPDKTAVAYQKRSQTFLIFAQPPPDKTYLGAEKWKSEDVRISSQPTKVTVYPNGYTVEEYRLDEAELAIPHNPNLIQGLHFR
jgi:hypothetical protein